MTMLLEPFRANNSVKLRSDPRLLKLPPYLSALSVIVGVVWLLVLPLPEYTRKTYVSESALLPGQVHTYFGGSDQYVFQAYRQEIRTIKEATSEEYDALS